MAIKKFFTGKSGAKFWVNIVLMVSLVVAVPVVTFYMLDHFTHHGEKIEVPNVVGKSVADAEEMLGGRDLVALVVDSVYDKYAPKGAVMDQSPKAGYEVKGGRVVYLTVNLMGEPMAELPDVAALGSLREAVSLLQSLGFKLTAHEQVAGRPRDLVIGVKQGGRSVAAGQSVPRTRPLTLVVGGGEVDSALVEYEDFEYEGLDGEGDEGAGENFDIEL